MERNEWKTTISKTFDGLFDFILDNSLQELAYLLKLFQSSQLLQE